MKILNEEAKQLTLPLDGQKPEEVEPDTGPSYHDRMSLEQNLKTFLSTVFNPEETEEFFQYLVSLPQSERDGMIKQVQQSPRVAREFMGNYISERENSREEWIVKLAGAIAEYEARYFWEGGKPWVPSEHFIERISDGLMEWMGDSSDEIRYEGSELDDEQEEIVQDWIARTGFDSFNDLLTDYVKEKSGTLHSKYADEQYRRVADDFPDMIHLGSQDMDSWREEEEMDTDRLPEVEGVDWTKVTDEDFREIAQWINDNTELQCHFNGGRYSVFDFYVGFSGQIGIYVKGDEILEAYDIDQLPNLTFDDKIKNKYKIPMADDPNPLPPQLGAIKNPHLFILARFLWKDMTKDIEDKATAQEIAKARRANQRFNSLCDTKSVKDVIRTHSSGFSIQDIISMSTQQITTHTEPTEKPESIQELSFGKTEGDLQWGNSTCLGEWKMELQVNRGFEGKNYVLRLNWMTYQNYVDSEYWPFDDETKAKVHRYIRNSIHPISKDGPLTLAWIRFTCLPDKNAVVLDEIQTDLEYRKNERNPDDPIFGTDWMRGWEYLMLRGFMEFVMTDLSYEKIYMPTPETKQTVYHANVNHDKAVNLYQNLPTMFKFKSEDEDSSLPGYRLFEKRFRDRGV